MHADRRAEIGRTVLASALAAGATVAQLVGSKAARDALFLSHHDVTRLPEMMAAAAVASLLAAVLAARAMARWSPARVVPVALAGNAALCVASWALIGHSPSLAGIGLYLQVAFLGATLSAGTWALINECFDPHTAKRVVGRVAMGGTAGGALGGLLGFALGRAGGVAAMLLVLAALNLLALWPVRQLAGRARARPVPERSAQTRSGFDVLQEHTYLRQLAFLVVLVAVTSALFDYVMSARVVARVPTGPDLVAFFALFHMGVGLASFAVQAFVTRAALARLGLGGTMALLPATALTAAGVALSVPALASAVLARGAEALVQSSVYRAAYEVAYTPVPRAQKRPAKMLIDVGFDRIGTALGSGLTLQVLPRAAQPEAVLLGLAVGVALLSLLTAVRLHRSYVAALAQSLKRGAIKLSAADVLDATTRRTLAESLSMNRQRLLVHIEELRRRDSSAPAPSGPGEDSLDGLPPDVRDEGFGSAPLSMRFGLTTESDASSSIASALDDLRSGSTARARACLTREEPLEPELVPATIDLLGNDELSRDALRALRRLGPRITGQLVDALSDEQLDVVVRRRIPRALESLADPRAVAGLVDALSAPELEVRRQAAFALERQAASSLPTDRVFSAVEQELEIAKAASDAPTTLSHVEHAVVVLSLVLEREPLGLAYRALGSGDETLRGTALEYFENVLPEALRATALPVLSRLVPRDRPKRDAGTLRDELFRTRGG